MQQNGAEGWRWCRRVAAGSEKQSSAVVIATVVALLLLPAAAAALPLLGRSSWPVAAAAAAEVGQESLLGCLMRSCRPAFILFGGKNRHQQRCCSHAGALDGLRQPLEACRGAAFSGRPTVIEIASKTRKRHRGGVHRRGHKLPTVSPACCAGRCRLRPRAGVPRRARPSLLDGHAHACHSASQSTWEMSRPVLWLVQVGLGGRTKLGDTRLTKGTGVSPEGCTHSTRQSPAHGCHEQMSSFASDEELYARDEELPRRARSRQRPYPCTTRTFWTAWELGGSNSPRSRPSPPSPCACSPSTPLLS